MLETAIAQAVAVIQDCLASSSQPYQECKIYHLAEALVKEKVFAWSDKPLIATYQKLFLCQAALCELYFQCEEQNTGQLFITPVSVYFVDQLKSGESALPQCIDQDALCSPNVSFFGNKRHFFDITEEEVAAMLEQFWRRFDDWSHADNALTVLGLADKASWKDIQTRYRSLASQNHPDKGGSREAFVKIRSAYEQLKRRRC